MLYKLTQKVMLIGMTLFLPVMASAQYDDPQIVEVKSIKGDAVFKFGELANIKLAYMVAAGGDSIAALNVLKTYCLYVGGVAYPKHTLSSAYHFPPEKRNDTLLKGTKYSRYSVVFQFRLPLAEYSDTMSGFWKQVYQPYISHSTFPISLTSSADKRVLNPVDIT